ncbi:MAG: acyltransferase, partial [Planctomycetes bacterium]|nr:acyltransferase [Planctomycetota bacterium]
MFFAVSGFLIPDSYKRCQSVADYFWRRARRIFPGLWACVMLSFGLVYLVDRSTLNDMTFGQMVIWLGCQMTVFQFWNPGFLRDFGVGVLNGSLWTISVELQFYLLVPVVTWLVFKWNAGKGVDPHFRLLFLVVVFAGIYGWFREDYESHPGTRDSVI